MNVGCDLSPLTKPRAGIRIYLEQLLAAFPSREDRRFIGYLPWGDAAAVPGPVSVRTGAGWTRRLPMLWMQCEGQRMAREDSLDLFWSTLYSVPRKLAGRVPIVTTVYDVMWKAMPETMRRRTRWASLLRAGFAIRSADRLIAISRATARDVSAHYSVDPAKIDVIHPGVSPVYGPCDPEEARRHVRERFGLEGRFLLSVGTVEPRKNLARLIRSVAGLPDVRLVIVGAEGWKSSPIHAEARRLDSTRLRFLGYVPDEDLRFLYGAAEGFAFPSLYEGFGLPVVEAMACGCPVMTSTVSSLPEAAGEAALLVDPLDEGQIATAVRRIWEDAALRERLRSAGVKQASAFGWREAARACDASFAQVRKSS